MMSEFGELVSRYRVARAMSQRELAIRAPCSISYLRALERGKGVEHSGEIAMKLGFALRLTADEMGVLLRSGGYVPEASPEPDDSSRAVRSAIGNDPALGRDGRRILIDMYELLADSGASMARKTKTEVDQPTTRGRESGEQVPEDSVLPVLYAVNDVADMLVLSPGTVRRLIRTGALGHARLGRQIRVSAQQIQDYVARNERPGGGPGDVAEPSPTDPLSEFGLRRVQPRRRKR